MLALTADRLAMALNVLLFQFGWFASVLGAANGLPWVGLASASVIAGWHIRCATHPSRELALLAVAAVVGTLFETLLTQTGWVRFPSGVLVNGAAPYWMVALWILFGTTLNVSLRWLRPRAALAALIGAVGAPAAYYAGARLGGLELVADVPALAAIAIGWAILTPALLAAARRLDGYAER
jgi:hypothetical protein